MSEMLSTAPLSPLRECATARSFTSHHLAANRAGDELTRHERRDDRQHLARRFRRASTGGRTVRVQRFDLVADFLRVGERARPRRHAHAYFVRIAACLGAGAVQGVDADEIAPYLTAVQSDPLKTLFDDLCRETSALERASAGVGNLALTDKPIAEADRHLQQTGPRPAGRAVDRHAIRSNLRHAHAAEI